MALLKIIHEYTCIACGKVEKVEFEHSAGHKLPDPKLPEGWKTEKNGSIAICSEHVVDNETRVDNVKLTDIITAKCKDA